MKRTATITALCIAMMGCHRETPKHGATKRVVHTAKTRVTEANKPVVDAIAALTPAKRVEMQHAIACEVQRRHRAGATTPLVVSAELVKSLSEQMEKNPAVARCARPPGV